MHWSRLWILEEIDLEAYVLISTEANASWQIAEALLKIEGVKVIHVVTAPSWSGGRRSG